MCCSPAATKGGAARAVPVVLGETTAPKDAVVVAVPSTSQRRRSGRPLAPSAARPLAVRRPAPAPRHAQTRVSREDLDRVRIALEQELAAGAPSSDEEIVERVSSSRHLHPLIVSIVLSKLREQNPAFFASYDAKKRENSMTTTATATTLTTATIATATPSASTSTAMLTSSGDASLRPTNSSSSEEEDDGGGDDEGGCNTDNNDRRDGCSSEDDAVVPLFA